MDSNDMQYMRYKEKTFTIRVAEEERELWKQAAWVRKVSLSEWARKVLTATAEATLKEDS